MKPVIILGTGLAGYSLAKEIRKRNTALPLRLFTADDGRAYSKPMLSNALTKGKSADQLASADAVQMAEQLNADIATHTPVVAIDRASRTVHTERGSHPYRQLVLALGADPVRLSFAGDGADEVMSVNDLDDYARFRRKLKRGDKVLILGAGLIGCEFANDLLNAGYGVTIVDPGSQPLDRLLPEACAAPLVSALQAEGLDWRLGTTARAVEKAGAAYRVTLADGECLDADLVLSAVGLRPRLQLAQQAGLACRRGIEVDPYLNTTDEAIHALGDCAEVDGLLLPFVMPIMHAARALAGTLSGEPVQVSYPAMPVVVKTPSCPLVVAPPPAHAEGRWQIDVLGEGATRAEFLDTHNRLAGFALTGSAVSEKQALTKRLPPVLG